MTQDPAMPLAWARRGLLAGPFVSLVALVPAMRHAARLDKKIAVGNSGQYVHHHAGLFVVYGLILTVPSLATAIFSTHWRRYAIGVVVVVLAAGLLCELFVSVTTSP
jgi:hypothetical protein